MFYLQRFCLSLLLTSTLFSSTAQASKGTQVGDILDKAAFAVDSGLLSAIAIKTLATCHYVSGLTVDRCIERMQLPVSKAAATAPITLYFHKEQKVAVAATNFIGSLLTRKYWGYKLTVVRCNDPLRGCVIDDELEPDYCDSSKWYSPDGFTDVINFCKTQGRFNNDR